jgi:hypothetical protein
VRSHVAGAKMLGGPLAPGRVHLARPTPDERAALHGSSIRTSVRLEPASCFLLHTPICACSPAMPPLPDGKVYSATYSN